MHTILIDKQFGIRNREACLPYREGIMLDDSPAGDYAAGYAAPHYPVPTVLGYVCFGLYGVYQAHADIERYEAHTTYSHTGAVYHG